MGSGRSGNLKNGLGVHKIPYFDPSHASVSKKTAEWLGAVIWPLSQMEEIRTTRFSFLDGTPKNEGYHPKNIFNDHFRTLILMWYGLLVWFGLVWGVPSGAVIGSLELSLSLSLSLSTLHLYNPSPSVTPPSPPNFSVRGPEIWKLPFLAIINM